MNISITDNTQTSAAEKISGNKLRTKAPYISLKSANTHRKAMFEYLKSLKETAVDIFHGNHFIDELDEAFLDDDDYNRAFDKARAVIAYMQLSIYGANSDINDKDLFPWDYLNAGNHSPTEYLTCELYREYGRQLHYIIAEKAQLEIIDDTDADSASNSDKIHSD